jgi:3-oxoacyl-[acyl-carrier protein] reductase
MDPIQSMLSSSSGRRIARRLGAELPPSLRRYSPGQPLLVGPALIGAAGGSPGTDRLAKPARAALERAGAQVVDAVPSGEKLGALVFDASGISDPAQLGELWDFFAGPLRALASGGRVLVLGTPPELAATAAHQVAQRALEGFTRSVAKELRGGSTAHLVLVAPGAEERIESTLRFLASARSAFVDGQVVRIGAGESAPATQDATAASAPFDWERPLDGLAVVVTGAARGIGAAMMQVLARDGAHVIGVDVAALAGDLTAVAEQVGGSSIVCDITLPDAAARIGAQAASVGGLHGIVHNAGITRDRKLVNSERRSWEQVLSVNLVAPQRITQELLDGGALRGGGRVVGVSSVAGIAGNVGQTSYAASKAGVIGLVDALKAPLAARGITVNAVAPGFIETQMTSKIPLVTREGGRRLSSLHQGGQPVDVAEVAAWLLSPASDAVTGNVVRACGQGLIGA